MYCCYYFGDSFCKHLCFLSLAMMWLYLSLELTYIGLLVVSCILLSAQLCIGAFSPSTQRWGQLLNAFAAVFTVLGGVHFFILDINALDMFGYFLMQTLDTICAGFRSAGHGGSHDVHASISDNSVNGTRGLQTSQLRLLVGFLVSSMARSENKCTAISKPNGHIYTGGQND